MEKNYQILDRNWRIREGEIDLVAISEFGVVVFIEVKTRTSIAFGHPLEAITREKAYRLQRLALAWLTVNHRWGFEYRIDAAAVLIPEGRNLRSITALQFFDGAGSDFISLPYRPDRKSHRC